MPESRGAKTQREPPTTEVEDGSSSSKRAKFDSDERDPPPSSVAVVHNHHSSTITDSQLPTSTPISVESESEVVTSSGIMSNSIGVTGSSAVPPPQGGLDLELYSRQIGTYGVETMGRLVKMNVLICGMQGVGVEIAKDLVLAGPASVTLCDDQIVSISDLGSNFFVSESDVNVMSRADAVKDKVSALNPYVSVSVWKGSALSESLIRQQSVVVVCNMSKSEVLKMNSLCRSLSVGLVVVGVYGLCTSIFVDFGDQFTVHDVTGEESRPFIVEGITIDRSRGTAVVLCHEDKLFPFEVGDRVRFREVEGLEELNNPALSFETVQVLKHQCTIALPESLLGALVGTYKRGGLLQTCKKTQTLNFKSFEESLQRPLSKQFPCLPSPDLSKFGQSEQLHIAVTALLEYQDQHNGVLPPPRDDGAVAECLRIAQKLNETYKADSSDFKVTVEEVSEQVVRNVCYFASCHLCPVAAFVGGIAAQEVVKWTGKYTPICQWMYYDCFEILESPATAAPAPEDCQKIGSRYDDQLVIWGKKMQDRLAGLKVFLAGAGALGCEYLKNLCMMGCCTTGKLVVTDMDRIETSNLNRQFLFHREHVGMSKSKTAADVVSQMNPDLKIEAREDKIGQDTEHIFTDDFWMSQDIIVNALDNIPSRLYIDSQCVWHRKPLLEAGTLGTKGNIQIILPLLTESYGDAQDPPEESIPLCTVRHFPNEIEHCIEWSRELFHSMFADVPQNANSLLADQEQFLTSITKMGVTAKQCEDFEKLLSFIQLKASSTTTPLQQCVAAAVMLFTQCYTYDIAQLLHNFPADHLTSTGVMFWSGPKRAPHVIEYDANDSLHLDFVMAAANLFALNLKLPEEFTDREAVRAASAAVKIEPFCPKITFIPTDNSANAFTSARVADDDTSKFGELKREILREMNNIPKNFKFDVAEFEKDNDANHHVDFISASANLRARNYTIAECDRLKVKLIAGKIIPAIATTTAMITGLGCIEFFKTISRESRKLEDFKNAFINLSVPVWILSEPGAAKKTVSADYDPIVAGPVRAKPEGFTTWDKHTIRIQDGTVGQLIDELAKVFDVDVLLLSAGNSCLYNSYLPAHKPRLERNVKELYEAISKTQLCDSKHYLAVQACCSDKADGMDVTIPTIEFVFH